ncbi:glycosyltransferase [Ammoniphilus sp. CFH 90114]|uniref:glycosyltransferase n=1 Tax=Ammoniphilus sp. CFH 90114 TaxID=2493665 RepID=UPI00100F8BF0|nr:glycosyltransferase [Ammoniphilus sp. CFH 90114]RXT13993.1 glycosyltransferase [Ammoniphilus sp. CFH 90114]
MINKVVYISTYIPQKCGLATYTHNLRTSINKMKEWTGIDPVIVVADTKYDHFTSHTEHWILDKDRKEKYRIMAERVNQSDISLVSLQHEFGIFGGDHGSHIIEFIKYLKKPLVTTFHTVSPKLPLSRRRLLKEIGSKSSAILVMNQGNRKYLVNKLLIPRKKVISIPHGSPSPPNIDIALLRKELKWSDKKVLLSFGFLMGGKGFGFILDVLPQVVRKVPNTLYVIIGETHSSVKEKNGESYRKNLQRKIKLNGLQDHVIMIDEYVSEDNLIKYISAADMVLVPYLNPNHSSSGVLTYAVGLGMPLLATPFTYAKEVLQGQKEIMIPYGNYAEWREQLTSFLSNRDRLTTLQKKISEISPTLHWSHIGKLHAKIFEQVHANYYLN